MSVTGRFLDGANTSNRFWTLPLLLGVLGALPTALASAYIGFRALIMVLEELTLGLGALPFSVKMYIYTPIAQK